MYRHRAWFTVFTSCLLLTSCGSSVRDTCSAVATPGTWHITATLFTLPAGVPYGFPGTCPSIDVFVEIPSSSSDAQGSVTFAPAGNEPEDRDRCFIRYQQGSATTTGRTSCFGEFEAGSPERTSGNCAFELGPPTTYADTTYLCTYLAEWQRVH